MRNRYPGRCQCGTFIAAGEGTVINKVNGKWRIACGSCATVSVVVRILVDGPLGNERHEPVHGEGMSMDPIYEELELRAARSFWGIYHTTGSRVRLRRAIEEYREYLDRMIAALDGEDAIRGEG